MGFTDTERINMTSKALAAGVLDAMSSGQWYESRFPFEFSLNGGKIWLEMDKMKQYPAGGPTARLIAQGYAAGPLASILKDRSQGATAIRLTPIPGTNQSTWVAYEILNDFTSARIDNWVMPAMIPQPSGAVSNGYQARLYVGGPPGTGTEVLTTDGATGSGALATVGWVWNYAMGMLLVSDDFSTTLCPAGDATVLYISGFTYIGKTAGGTTDGAGDILPYTVDPVYQGQTRFELPTTSPFFATSVLEVSINGIDTSEYVFDYEDQSVILTPDHYPSIVTSDKITILYSTSAVSSVDKVDTTVSFNGQTAFTLPTDVGLIVQFCINGLETDEYTAELASNKIVYTGTMGLITGDKIHILYRVGGL